MSNLFVGPFFEIIAGPDQTKFFAHASVLEKSETLRVIVQGKWKDSTELKIVLKDWDPETVGRLLEWLYTGDYESPYPTEVPLPGAESLEVLVPETSIPSNENTKEKPQSTSKSESASGSRRPLPLFANMHFNKIDADLRPSNAEAFKQWAVEREDAGRWQGKEYDKGDLDFEVALLAHAKLYAFADYMLLPALQAHAFERLRALLHFIREPTGTSDTGLTLLSPPLEDMRLIGNIITLVQYVYANTAKLESEEEPLRELTSTFIAPNYVPYADLREDKGKMFEKALGSMEQSEDIREDVNDKVRRNEFAMKRERKALRKARRKELRKLEKEALKRRAREFWFLEGYY